MPELEGLHAWLDDRDHLQLVTLPWSRDLANAIERLGDFLAGHRQLLGTESR